MPELENLAKQLILKNGPLRLDQFMELALLHPTYGYYNKRQPIGKIGTFTTAPEMTQIFGELIGLCFAHRWKQFYPHQEFALLELGPGRGTLMADCLRATSGIEQFNPSCRLFLFERSTSLKAQQKCRLNHYQPTWIDRLDTLPQMPLFVIANEFFDALPVRQFQRGKVAWKEKVIDLSKGRLDYRFQCEAPFEPLNCRLSDTQEGDLIEHREGTGELIEAIARGIKNNGGMGLIIDYGEIKSQGDTFQAIGQQGFTDTLSNPGESDLTAHVDFGSMISVAHNFVDTCLTEQGTLLSNLGIQIRSQHLAQNMRGLELESHWAAINRLVHPQEMGRLFKALTLFPKNTSTPEGF